MNTFEHAFDPLLTEMFSQRITGKSVSRVKNTAEGRCLFYQLNLSGKQEEIIYRAFDFVYQNIKAVEHLYPPNIKKDFDLEELTYSKDLTIVPLSEQLLTQKNQMECINQCSSILLTQPCWLQNISQISCSQNSTAVKLISIYLNITRTEQDIPGLLESYRALLLASGFKSPTLYSYCYSQQPRLISEVFDFASIQLCLAQFPRVFLAEILGFTLAYFQIPTLIEVCFPNHQLSSHFIQLRHKRVEKQLAPLLDCIKNYLNLFTSHKQLIWKRIQNGFYLYFSQMQHCRDQLNNYFAKTISPQQAVSMLIQQKLTAAIGHHQKIQLQDISLDEWFAGMPENNLAFLQALKKSDYVDCEKPENSSLLKLFAFKGPMFGVLDESERVILKNWLMDETNEAPLNLTNVPEIPTATMPTSNSVRPAKKYTKLTNRKLYYYLLNADLFPDVLSTAKRKVHKLLRLCALFNPPPFKHYTHEQFDAYIKDIYQRENQAYRPLLGKPKISREAYIWGLEQIAPMILIDGCWLQNSLDVQNFNSDICEILFSIYSDEIGNGRLEQNHPHIFQQLLDSLSIEVPPAHSAEFVDHPGFINSAFDLPVFMLSLSHFTVEFLPELLGLNMAIELSGLGKGYKSLVDEWNYWGIDPTIANIHLSIDNYASGHTFLAKKAIQLYMDEALKSAGNSAILDMHWRRINSGYASLQFVGSRFKSGLPVLYLIHKFKSKN